MKTSINSLFIFLILLTSFFRLDGLTVGSDSLVSRQNLIMFPNSDTDNLMKGFAAFEGGFRLEDQFTSCTFDSVFPVSGTVDINCGTLYLQKDLILDQRAVLESLGYIYGNGNRLQLPDTVTTLSSHSVTAQLTFVDDAVQISSVYSADWSYAGSYTAACTPVGVGNNLTVYSFDRETQELTFITGVDVGVHNYSLNWHPEENYLAVGSAPVDSEYAVLLYEFDGVNLTVTDSLSVPGMLGTALAWSPDGNYLTAGYFPGGWLEVYTFSDGLLESTGHTADLPAAHSPWLNAMEYDSTGSYIGLACYGTGNTPVYIYHYDGLTLTPTYTLSDTNGMATDVDWTITNSLLAMCIQSGSDQLRVYRYDRSLNTLTELTRTSVDTNVYSVRWISDTDLLVGLWQSGGTELRMYRYVDGLGELQFLGGAELSTGIYDVNVDSEKAYAVTADITGRMTVFSITKPWQNDEVTLENLIIDIQNDILWDIPAYMGGNCTINGNGHRLTIGDNGYIAINALGRLTFKNMEICGLESANFSCQDNNASVVLQDCTIYLNNDYTFATGGMSFAGEVVFSGTNQFNYTSIMTSTIESQASLSIKDGAVFRYAPAVANRDLLVMTNNSSKIILDGCTLKSTTTGLRLTKGNLYFDNHVTLSCEGVIASESICFGNGFSTSDLQVTWLSGAQVTVEGGLHENNMG